MIGEDCPACDGPLGYDPGCRRCGWMPTPAQSEPAPSAGPHCDECGLPNPWRNLTIGEDGHARDAGCHVNYLRRRAQKADADPEVTQCKTEFRQLADRALVKWATKRG